MLLFSDLSKDTLIRSLSFLSSDELLAILEGDSFRSRTAPIEISIAAMQILLSLDKTKVDFDYQKKAMKIGLGGKAERLLHRYKIDVDAICNRVKELLCSEQSDLAHKVQGIVFLCKMKQIQLPQQLLDDLFAAPISLPGYIEMLAPLVSKQRAPVILAKERAGRELFRESRHAHAVYHLVHVLPLLDPEAVRQELDNILKLFNEFTSSDPLDQCLESFKKVVPLFSSEQCTLIIDLSIKKMSRNDLFGKVVSELLAIRSVTPKDIEKILFKIKKDLVSKSKAYADYYATNPMFLHPTPLTILASLLPQLTDTQISDLLNFALDFPFSTITLEIIIILGHRLNENQVSSIIELFYFKLQNNIDILRLLTTLAKKTPQNATQTTTTRIVEILSQNFIKPEIHFRVINTCLPHLTASQTDIFFGLFLPQLTATNEGTRLRVSHLLPGLLPCLSSEQTNALKAGIWPMLSSPDLRLKTFAHYILNALAEKITAEESTKLMYLLSDSTTFDAQKLILSISNRLTEQQHIDCALNIFMAYSSGNNSSQESQHLMNWISFIPNIRPDKAELVAEHIEQYLHHPTILRTPEVNNVIKLAQEAINLLLLKINNPQFISKIIKKTFNQGYPENRQFVINQISKRMFKGEPEGFDLDPNDISQEAQLLRVILHAWASINQVHSIEASSAPKMN